jgi:hypothetical protein
VASSAIEGQLEVTKDAGVVAVYGWQGSTMRVYRGEELVEDFSTPVPKVPPRQSMRSFIESLFGGPRESP